MRENSRGRHKQQWSPEQSPVHGPVALSHECVMGIADDAALDRALCHTRVPTGSYMACTLATPMGYASGSATATTDDL